VATEISPVNVRNIKSVSKRILEVLLKNELDSFWLWDNIFEVNEIKARAVLLGYEEN
jgi:hypothetical protein